MKGNLFLLKNLIAKMKIYGAQSCCCLLLFPAAAVKRFLFATRV